MGLFSYPSFLIRSLDESDICESNSNLLQAWIIRQVSLFLVDLAKDLDKMMTQSKLNSREILDYWNKMSMPNGCLLNKSAQTMKYMDDLFTKLKSIISQSMYFGRSLNRIGCDFRPHLAILFNNVIESFVRVRFGNLLSLLLLCLNLICLNYDNLLW